jgi:calcium-dependent protein kinase
MGNLCSSAAKDNRDAEVNTGDGAVGAPSINDAAKPAHTGKKPADPIEASLQAARRELDKNKGRDFEALYTLSKLIGHGAFAKVSICDHNQTKVSYAAKVVAKNAEEADKQRDGACAAVRASQ